MSPPTNFTLTLNVNNYNKTTVYKFVFISLFSLPHSLPTLPRSSTDMRKVELDWKQKLKQQCAQSKATRVCVKHILSELTDGTWVVQVHTHPSSVQIQEARSFTPQLVREEHLNPAFLTSQSQQ